AGTIVLANGTLDLTAPGAAGSGPINFDPDPTLMFTVANAPSANPINDFFVGSTLDIVGFTAKHSFYSSPYLTLSNGSGGTVTLDIPGLNLSKLQLNGSIITTTQPACFAAGTRIATPHGDRAVESLQPGDAVIALDRHGAKRAETVRWVGRRLVDLAADQRHLRRAGTSARRHLSARRPRRPRDPARRRPAGGELPRRGARRVLRRRGVHARPAARPGAGKLRAVRTGRRVRRAHLARHRRTRPQAA